MIGNKNQDGSCVSHTMVGNLPGHNEIFSALIFFANERA
jgi:hypothetical protein